MSMDKWARFLANEKLVPSRIGDHWTMKLVELCEKLASVRGPKIRPHKDKLESRRFVCLTAMEMGIDLPAIKHKVTGRKLIGRGLLDAWNKAGVEKYGSVVGTQSVYESKRRDVVTRLCKEFA